MTVYDQVKTKSNLRIFIFLNRLKCYNNGNGLRTIENTIFDSKNVIGNISIKESIPDFLSNRKTEYGSDPSADLKTSSIFFSSIINGTKRASAFKAGSPSKLKRLKRQANSNPSQNSSNNIKINF